MAGAYRWLELIDGWSLKMAGAYRWLELIDGWSL
jgi:hypothetical protein